MRHIIGILLQNESGALSRVAALFSSRGYNIESLTVAATNDPGLSRITLVTKGSDAVVAQIANQLHRLIDVIAVDDMTGEDHLERELALIKLRVRPAQREAIRALLEKSGGRLLAEERDCQILELAASEAEVSQLVQQLSAQAELLEIVRSGALAMSRQEHTLHVVES
jgi:acetolactate synthase-1/3 small subunit